MNLFKQFLDLIPTAPLLVGRVISIDNGVATIEEPSGALSQARGSAAVGATVFFRDNVIEGDAPDLPEEDIDV